MKRHNYIESIYKQLILKNFISSFAGDEEELAKLQKELEEAQKKQERLNLEKKELETFEEEPEISPETETSPEEIPELSEEVPELPEEILEGEKIEMPHSIEKGQQAWSWAEPEQAVPGVLKKYSPGAVLAKTCPVCHFENRPIYINECQNCKKVYKHVQKVVHEKMAKDKNYPMQDIFKELSKKYKYLTSQALRQIYMTSGKTPLKEVFEVYESPKKQLQDMIWYRLNVKKDKNGEPLLDNLGRPIPLDQPKYFSTEEITNILHVSPEVLQNMVIAHNAKILENIPEEIRKDVHKDEWGNILPTSLKVLSRYGYVGPSVSMGIGNADVRRRVSKEQEENLSPEQIHGLQGPAFKSSDISAWNWEKLGPIFGWDPKENKFTHGWGKFLQEKFLPIINKHKLESKKKAIENVIKKYQDIVNYQRAYIKKIWDAPQNDGLRTYTYFKYNPKMTIKNFKNIWSAEFQDFKDNYWKISLKNSIEKSDRLPIEIKNLIDNYLQRKNTITPEEFTSLVDVLSEGLNMTKEKVEQALDTLDEAQELIFEKPPEIDYYTYLVKHPYTTLDSLKNRYENRRKDFENNIWEKKEEVAKLFENKIWKLKEKIPEIQTEIDESISKDLNLYDEVKKFEQSQEKMPQDSDPQINKDLKEAETEIEKANPPPQPHELGKTSSIKERLFKLAEKQLSLFGLEPEPKEEEKSEKPTGVQMWKEKRPDPFIKKQGFEYPRIISYINKSLGKVENKKNTFKWQGIKTFEDELTNNIGSYGYHNFGVRPNDFIFVTLTDSNGNKEIFKFQMDKKGSGPVNFIGITNAIDFISEPESLPEPEIKQEEKAQEEPVEDFGKIQGKYFVYFEWNPDYGNQPNSYKAFFNYNPSHRKLDFEELLKQKIEMRFGPKIVSLMMNDNPKTNKKYVHVTVIEPTTERRRRFGAVFNRETGEFIWHGTGGIVERKEKERRLELDKNKLLKTELNLGVIKLEDIELIGDDDLKIIQKGQEDIMPQKEKLYFGISPKEKEHTKDLKKIKKEREENLTPEERQKMEQEKEETKLKWEREMPGYQEPSGKITEYKTIEKIVAKRGFIRKEVPEIDPISKKPATITDPATGVKETVMKKVVIPKIDHFLVTIRLDSNGEPKSAKCEKTTVIYKETGAMTEKPKYVDILKQTRDNVHKINPKLKGQDFKDMVNIQYKENVEKTYGKDADPFQPARLKEPYLSSEVKGPVRPCLDCPNGAIAPFENACEEIKAAISSMENKEIPQGYEVWDKETVQKREERESSREIQERRRKHDVTDFYSADDRYASRFDKIVKLTKL